VRAVGRSDPQARDQPTELPQRGAKYGEVSAWELKQLKDPESKKAKLRRRYADLALENAAIKAVLTRKL
jgi:hypothetical protein